MSREVFSYTLWCRLRGEEPDWQIVEEGWLVLSENGTARLVGLGMDGELYEHPENPGCVEASRPEAAKEERREDPVL